MTARAISRDEAKGQARERLAEVLAEVVPGFRPERAFRCLNPDHEDRHPSMRYLSRANVVKCFACGWTGDVFDVVGAVYGLTGGDAFAKVYDMLALAPMRGGYRKTVKPTPPKPAPGSVADILAIIYPPGWNAPDVVKLPLPLEVTAEAETGLCGILAKRPEAVATCRECGLEGAHFDDAEFAGFYADLCRGVEGGGCCAEFVAWLRQEAAPDHMLRRLARFIIGEGQLRRLEAVFAHAFSLFENETAAGGIFHALLEQAEAITHERYAPPDGDEEYLRIRLVALFARYQGNDDVRELVGEFRSEGGGA